MPAPLNRALFGFVAAVVSVLTFHQGMGALLHLADTSQGAATLDRLRLKGFALPRLAAIPAS